LGLELDGQGAVWVKSELQKWKEMERRQNETESENKSMVRLDDAAFRGLFAKNPVKRIGRDRFVRNVLYAIGNSGDATLAAEAHQLLDDPAPLVRGAAVWALSRLAPEAFAELRTGRLATERDALVCVEWAQN
jgi:epoxyqueuosine reductase